MASIIKADTLQSTTANVFILNSSGTEYARFDSSGNMGIGTSSPTSYVGYTSLALNNATSGGVYDILTNGTRVASFFSTDVATTLAAITSIPLTFRTANTERMRIDSSGNVGIGGTSGGEKLEVFGGIEVSDGASSFNRSGLILDYQTGSSTGRIAAGPNAGGTLAFYTGSGSGVPERMRIDSSGNLLVGLTSSTIGGDGGKLLIDNGSGLSLLANRTGDGNIVRWYRTNTQVGSINLTSGATAYVTSSDYRLKEDIAPMTGALAKVAALKPVTYKWKLDGSNGQGFIAHELAEVVPQCVSGDKDAVKEDGSIDPQGIDTSFLVATLTAAIQEQQALITQLQADVAALKAK